MESPLIVIVIAMIFVPTLTIVFVITVNSTNLLSHQIAPPLEEQGLGGGRAGRAAFVHKVDPADENAGKMSGMTDIARSARHPFHQENQGDQIDGFDRDRRKDQHDRSIRPGK